MGLQVRTVSVTKKYDNIALVSVEGDFPRSPMGFITDIPATAKRVVGTPNTIIKEIAARRKQNTNEEMILMIDGALMDNFNLVEYLLGEVAYGKRKIWDVEITRVVED